MWTALKKKLIFLQLTVPSKLCVKKGAQFRQALGNIDTGPSVKIIACLYSFRVDDFSADFK